MRRRTKRGRSTYEAKIMEDLEARGIKYEYETLKLKYVKDFCPHCKLPSKEGVYTPDFIIGDLICEAKGYFDSENRSLMLAVKRDNPELKIALLFQRNQPIRKGSKTKYMDWATKNGFICEVGNTIPEEWIK